MEDYISEMDQKLEELFSGCEISRDERPLDLNLFDKIKENEVKTIIVGEDDKTPYYSELSNSLNNLEEKIDLKYLRKGLDKLKSDEQLEVYTDLIQDMVKYRNPEITESLSYFAKDIEQLDNGRLNAYHKIAKAAIENNVSDIKKITNRTKFNLLYFSDEKVDAYVSLSKKIIENDSMQASHGMKTVFTKIKDLEVGNKLDSYVSKITQKIAKGKTRSIYRK